MRIFACKWVSACSALAVLMIVADQSQAALIVENSPTTTAAYEVGNYNKKVSAVSWEQQASSNTAITALVASINGSRETIDAYLSYGLQSNLIASATVPVSNFSRHEEFQPVTLFTGLDLAAGTYFLTLFNKSTSLDFEVRWAIGLSTTDTSNGRFLGSAVASGLNTNSDQPYLSGFIHSGEALGFSVTGTTVVPEPSTGGLAGIGAVVLAMGAFRRRCSIGA